MSKQIKKIITRLFFISALACALVIPTLFAGATTVTSLGSTAIAAPLSSASTLKIEDVSPSVLQLQQYLNNNGYIVNEIKGEPGSIGHETNKFGLKTKQALIRFQKDHNITPADGIFGPQTKAKILEVASAVTSGSSDGAVLGLATTKASGSGPSASGGGTSPRYLYSLNITKSGNGAQGSSVTIASSIAPAGINQPNMYLDGSIITLTPVPAAGYTFAGWSGEGLSGTGVVTVVMNANKSITATFVRPQHTLTILPNEGDGQGNITGATNGQTFADGDIVTLTGIASVGSKVGTWFVNGMSVASTYTVGASLAPDQITYANITMNQDINVGLPFNIARYPFTISKGGTGSGDVSTSPYTSPYGSNGYKGLFPSGTSVAITATAHADSTFDGLVGNGVSCNTSPCTVTTGNTDPSITAVFTAKAITPIYYPPTNTTTTTATSTPPVTPATSTKYTLKVNLKGSGSGEVYSGGGSFLYINCGDKCQATLASGSFVELFVNDELNPNDIRVTHPNSKFDHWGGDCVGSMEPCRLEMDGNKNVDAFFVTDTTPLVSSTPTPPVPPTPPINNQTSSLQIKTTSALNTFVKNTTFLTSTIKTNFTENAKDILGNGAILNLNFTTAKDGNSIGLYKAPKSSSVSVPLTMYLEDEVTINGQTCARTVSMSRTNKNNSNTPLLNKAKDGICAVKATAESLISTLNLGTPAGWPPATTTASSGTNGSTRTVVWNNLFLERLAKNSKVPITKGVLTYDIPNFYSSYTKALNGVASSISVNTFGIDWLPGGKIDPDSITPITSNLQDQIIAIMSKGKVDCTLHTTSHASHIKRAWKSYPISSWPSGYLNIEIENDLNQGEEPSYANAPFNGDTTTFQIDKAGNIMTVSGAEASGFWSDHHNVSTFFVQCVTLSN